LLAHLLVCLGRVAQRANLCARRRGAEQHRR
jgi:hypothetical protein